MNWKEIKEHYQMTVTNLSKRTGVPKRTLEDWIAGRRTPPDYITKLLIEKLEEKPEGQKKIIEEPKKGTNIEFLKKRSPLERKHIEEILGEEYTIEDELIDLITDIEIIEDETDIITIRRYLKKIKEVLEKITE